MRFVERTSDDLTRRLPQARESGVAPRAQFQKQAHLPIICPNFWPRKTLRSTRQRLLTHTSNRDEVPHPAAVPIFFNIGCRGHPCKPTVSFTFNQMISPDLFLRRAPAALPCRKQKLAQA